MLSFTLPLLIRRKFRKPVVPGDKLVYKTQILKIKSRFCVFEAKAFVDDELVAQAELKATVSED